ncbi:VOC family protein [Streptacidiphilus monticola]|jgi:predicted 3-demethylubiquinone-9 3-methyltransferase (glyoxalase superfamily)|uniref:VOC family protein n=1 Tax=Streptacidiphilus monticola TaxID=2161674 RepID=A0ABW1G616_9ACTN
MSSHKQKITTFLWFDDQAQEAAEFYVSVFGGESRITDVQRYGEAGPGKAGSVMTVAFELAGQQFVALNGGPMFPFTEAISLSVDCADQAEVDRYWEALTSGGGQESQCGWLKDKYGLSWQIVPRQLPELLGDPDPARAQRAMQAMLQMRKLDVAALRAAADAG